MGDWLSTPPDPVNSNNEEQPVDSKNTPAVIKKAEEASTEDRRSYKRVSKTESTFPIVEKEKDESGSYDAEMQSINRTSGSLGSQAARESVSGHAGDDAGEPPTKKPYLSEESSTRISPLSESDRFSRALQTAPSSATEETEAIINTQITSEGGQSTPSDLVKAKNSENTTLVFEETEEASVPYTGKHRSHQHNSINESTFPTVEKEKDGSGFHESQKQYMDKASTSLRLQEARASVSRSAGEDADGPPTKKPHLSVQSSTTHSLPSENGQLSRAPQTIPSAGTKKKTISDVIGNIGMTGNGGSLRDHKDGSATMEESSAAPQRKKSRKELYIKPRKIPANSDQEEGKSWFASDSEDSMNDSANNPLTEAELAGHSRATETSKQPVEKCVRQRDISEESVYKNTSQRENYTSWPLICQSSHERKQKIQSLDTSEDTSNLSEETFYYRDQMILAEILFNRLMVILQSRWENMKIVSDIYREIEFLIFTAKLNSLQTQTVQRLVHQKAGIAPSSLDAEKRQKYGEDRVLKYQVEANETRLFNAFREKVERQRKKDEDPVDAKRTLFLVVADESHWGTTGENIESAVEGIATECPPTKKIKKKIKAYNEYINKWDGYKDVVVLQVSATPFNLLTTNSRLPLKYFREADSEFPVKKELHIVHWSEVDLKKFWKGCVAYLTTARRGNYVTVKGDDVLATSERSAVFIQTSSCNKLDNCGEVICLYEYDEDKDEKRRMLGVYTGKTKRGEKISHLRAIPVGDNNPFEMGNYCFNFEIFVDSGVGIVSLRACCETQKGFLQESEEQEALGVGKYRRIMVNTEIKAQLVNSVRKLSPIFAFYLDIFKVKERKGLTERLPTRYLSLNFYINTILRDKEEERRVRHDEQFSRIETSMLPKSDSKAAVKESERVTSDFLLTCDYALHLLWLSSLKQSTTKHQYKFRLLLDDFKSKLSPEEKEIFSDYYESFKKALAGSFTKKLEKVFPEKVEKCEELRNYLFHVEELLPNDFLKYFDHKSTDFLRKIVQCLPTADILFELLEEGATGIKIVRVKRKNEGEQMAGIVKKAMEAAEKTSFFFVICDFGSKKINEEIKNSKGTDDMKVRSQDRQCSKCKCAAFKRAKDNALQCKECTHQHFYFNTYEDLRSLPCLLILVNKARMGDTFPPSMNCMDLRLFHTKETSLTLSHMMQELGRMCRYVDRDTEVAMPYALIGQSLFRKLEKHLKECAAFTAITLRPDNKMIKTTAKETEQRLKWKKEKDAFFDFRWLKYRANPTSCDFGNANQHENRLLLQAEPQIGKTGTFLYFIKLLKNKICCEEYEELIEGSDEETDQDGRLVEAQPQLTEARWLYPDKKIFKWETKLRLNYGLARSKYEFLKFDPNEKKSSLVSKILSKFPLIKKDRKNVSKKKGTFIAKVVENFDFRAFSIDHSRRNCHTCLSTISGKRKASIVSVQNKYLQEELKIREVKVSVPIEDKFKLVRNALGRHDEYLNLQSFCWVFVPSYNRSKRALLNYSHLLDEDVKESLVFALVVRESEFEEYIRDWGKFHLVIKLPSIFDVPEAVAEHFEKGYCFKVDIGGIGYSRLFIQLFCYSLHLTYAFQMDDNISSLYCIDIVDEESRENIIRMKRTTLSKVLSHLWKQFDLRSELPDKLKEENHECKNIVDYSGQPEDYGLLGMKCDRLCYKRAPFRHGRFGGFFLLNVAATVEKDIYFMPTPCMEDIMFCNDCDSKKLLCCKYGRFVFVKANLADELSASAQNPDPIPDMYVWNIDTKLCVKDGTSIRRIRETLLQFLKEKSLSWLACYSSFFPEAISKDETLKEIFEIIKSKMKEFTSESDAIETPMLYSFFDPNEASSDVIKFLLKHDLMRLKTETKNLFPFAWALPAEVAKFIQLESKEKFLTLFANLISLPEKSLTVNVYSTCPAQDCKRFSVLVCFIDSKG